MTDGTRADLSRLAGHAFPAVTQAYDERDCMLYALGLGLGQDPCAPEQLRHVQGDPVATLPMMSAVLASPTEWMRDPALGIVWQRLVALSHRMEFHRALPARGVVRSQTRVSAVYDCGSKGARIHWERDLVDAVSGDLLAVLKATALARDNSGFGGAPAPARPRGQPPAAAPAFRFRWRTLPIQGLVYRLSGDMNPLHSDPDVARQAGFERPILHGLCSLAICGLGLIDTVCAGRPVRLRALSASYAGIVYPGETLEMDIWPDTEEVQFQCRVLDRSSLAVAEGTARIAHAFV
ncbi:MaoC/PaaZ C-terminal domain-containing protein [Bordetella genomosp. 13]|uniref:MaoC/PaaZ C-terminal domain-containing protein n=1 Tax=Bordetella genomosp. 13 TaxID=463040 RepID=UPI0011A5DD0A|nr:MaoC/PaaZ C-terminal domain-containing protein [Bordetella genomosp. 13]